MSSSFENVNNPYSISTTYQYAYQIPETIAKASEEPVKDENKENNNSKQSSSFTKIAKMVSGSSDFL